MTEEFIEVHWTCGSLDEARHVSRFLVQERYAASAQIIPWFESVFMLDNKLDTSQESKVILKTRLENFDKIKEEIERISKYEIPEIIWFKIDGANPAFKRWLQESTLALLQK